MSNSQMELNYKLSFVHSIHSNIRSEQVKGKKRERKKMCRFRHWPSLLLNWGGKGKQVDDDDDDEVYFNFPLTE